MNTSGGLRRIPCRLLLSSTLHGELETKMDPLLSIRVLLIAQAADTRKGSGAHGGLNI